MRGLVGLTASLLVLTAVSPTGAQPPPEPTPAPLAGQVSAKPQQHLAHPERLAQRVHPSGWTTLVKGPLRTRSGKKVRVRVKVADATGLGGKKVRYRTHSLIRRTHRGKVRVWLRGSDGVRITVRLTADPTKKRAAFSQRIRYFTIPSSYPGGLKAQRTGFGSQGGFEMIGLSFFEGILSGIGDKIGERLGGWALGALFGTEGDDPRIGEIVDKLDALQNQLTALNAQIDELRSELKDAVCTITTAGLADQIGTIRAANTEYAGLVQNHDTGQKALLHWADSYETQLKTALAQIDTALMGTAAPGTIVNCATSFHQRWQQPLAEAAYYHALYQYLGYFYQYQVLGLNLVVEAEHLRAAVSAGSAMPTDPRNAQQICITPPNADTKTACDTAATWANQVYNNLVGQAVRGGAGYSWNVTSGKHLATQVGTTRLWAIDLNAFGDTSGCKTPLSSVGAPCGPTVGTLEPLPAQGLGYGGWGIAGQNAWFSIIAGHGTGEDYYSNLMDAAGFNPGLNKDLIIYTGESVDGRSAPAMRFTIDQTGYNPGIPGSIKALCFLDTQVYAKKWDMPICSGSKTLFTDTLDHEEDSGMSHNGTGETWWTRSDYAASGSRVANPDWYRGQVHAAIRWVPPDDIEPDWIKVETAPAWMQLDGGPLSTAYRWPVIDLNSAAITCKPLVVNGVTYQLTKTQAGGAYTMCGDDFAAWLKTWVPDKPAG